MSDEQIPKLGSFGATQTSTRMFWNNGPLKNGRNSEALARRTVKQSIAMGELLLGLQKSPHGTWLPRLERLERLGIASTRGY